MSSPRVLAVDSGAGHVACGLFSSAKNGRLVLEQFALESFNPDASLEAQWTELVSQSLSAAARRAGASGSAVLSVPGHHTLTKFVKTPAVDKAKRDKVIQFEAQQNIPYPLPEVVWDYLTVSDDGLDLEVMLAAVKLDVAEALCHSIQDAGVSASSIAPSTVALYRSFKYNYPDASGPVLVVNIGARSTNLLFIDGNRFFIRTIALAGNSVTQTIADELKQEFSHAESLKLQVLGGTSDLPESSPARTTVLHAAQSFIGRLHMEITRSTVNYRRQNGAEQPATIYVTGGGSLVPDLTTTLADKLKISVEVFDPLRNVEVSASAALARDYAPVLADLIGLAVGNAAGEKSFTLLPPAIGEAIAFRKQQPFYIGAAALVVLALALPIVHFNQRAAVSAEQAQLLEARLQPLRALKNADTANLAKIETLKNEITAIQGLVESKSNWINFFTDLQQRLVKVQDVWLEKLQVLRPAPGDTVTASAGGFFGADTSGANNASVQPVATVLRLNLSGRLLDRANPTSKVSPDSLNRVRSLLASFADSQFISSVEKETFNTNQPGILSFDFILVVDPKKPL
ncbi:pilus assembly protein PilM [Rariglobus hedericola]|uniref:Fimbrial assembly protein n=1 Tax=Rariglobus hedericola TaxID=2597822 RepID=A0A556QQC2_9BACT|nr:pilus assembly protein PilM [Rariglobus hedericola]TSJ78838.1 fimbrial assembly protein [Rariglobus hedericola]